MKRKIIWILILLLIAAIFTARKFPKSELKTSPDSVNFPATTKNKNIVELDYKDRKIAISWFKVDAASRLKLLANFKNKKTAKEVYAENKCKALVNAGFYNQGDTPIGLFINADGILSSYQKNSTFNGFFYQEESGKYYISAEVPINSRITLQTGPILIEKGVAKNLKIKNDSFERRVAAVLTDKNNLFFLIFYDKDSNYLGPQLTDLPGILEIFAEKINEKIIDAINLDGGSASAFISEDTYLTELTNVGSFFCLH